MSIGLLIIGDEILSGKRADRHLPKVIEILRERGLQLTWANYIGDDPARITEILKKKLCQRRYCIFLRGNRRDARRPYAAMCRQCAGRFADIAPLCRGAYSGTHPETFK